MAVGKNDLLHREDISIKTEALYFFSNLATSPSHLPSEFSRNISLIGLAPNFLDTHIIWNKHSLLNNHQEYPSGVRSNIHTLHWLVSMGSLKGQKPPVKEAMKVLGSLNLIPFRFLILIIVVLNQTPFRRCWVSIRCTISKLHLGVLLFWQIFGTLKYLLAAEICWLVLA